MTHPADVFTTFSSPVELPDIQDIEKMDRDKSEAIEALEIVDGDKVRCQRCRSLHNIVPNVTIRPNSSRRIEVLKERLELAEPGALRLVQIVVGSMTNKS